MSENTQLNANYMRCNKEELDKLEEFDKSEYDLLSEFTDITGYDVTCVINRLGVAVLPKLKEINLLDKFSKLQVESLIKKLGINILPNLKEVGLLDRFNENDVYRLIKELGQDVLPYLQEVELLKKLDKYTAIELIKELGINILPNLKEVGLLDRLDGYEVSGLIKELGINILSNLKEVGLLDKMGSNNVERIIEDYNFDKDVLLKLNEFDLLYNVDINFIKRSFVKELKAGLAINPDIYNTNNIHKVLYAEYDLSTLKFLISKAIKEKDYETLKSITESHNYNEFIGLNYIKEYLDLNAIKVILNNTKFAHPLFKNIVIKNLKLDLGYYKDFCDTSAKEKLKDILYYIYEWQISNKAKLNAGHTNTLIEEVSYLSAFEFYQTHLEDFRFGKEGVKKLSFMFDEIRINPKLFIESIDKKVCLNDELGPLLSRTYSKELSIDNVKRIYQDIYASSKIGEVIIRYINQNIIRGDDIVINFTDKEKFSNFDPSGNKVTISLLQPFITIEAITVHEIGHYVIQSVFNSLIPGDICKYFNNEESKLEYVGDWKYIKSKDNGHYLGRYKEQLCFNPRISMFIKAYSDATKVILFKAVDILKLGMIAEDYKDYIARDLAVDLSKSSAMLSLLALDDSIYLEESQKMDKLNDENLHSIILNMLKYPELEKDLITDIKLIVLSNKLYQHMQEQNKLLSNIRGNDKLVENPKLQEEIDHVAFQTSQFSEIFTNMTNSQSISKQLQDLLFNRYLPALKSKLDLSEGESYFINRMVDLIGRTEEGAIYFEGEAVVRCIELEVESKFKGISEDIMKACDKMNQFWEEFILPEMDLN